MVERMVVPQLPPSLTRACRPMQDYPEDLNGIVAQHGRNMEAAGRCAARHQAVVDTLEALRVEAD